MPKQQASCVLPAPSAEKSLAEILRLALVDSERGDALQSDLLEEVASIANALVQQPFLVSVVKVVVNARTLKERPEPLSPTPALRCTWPVWYWGWAALGPAETAV